MVKMMMTLGRQGSGNEPQMELVWASSPKGPMAAVISFRQPLPCCRRNHTNYQLVPCLVRPGQNPGCTMNWLEIGFCRIQHRTLFFFLLG